MLSPLRLDNTGFSSAKRGWINSCRSSFRREDFGGFGFLRFWLRFGVECIRSLGELDSSADDAELWVVELPRWAGRGRILDSSSLSEASLSTFSEEEPDRGFRALFCDIDFFILSRSIPAASASANASSASFFFYPLSLSSLLPL